MMLTKAIQLAIQAAESISQSLSEVNQRPSRLGGFYSNLLYSLLMGKTT